MDLYKFLISTQKADPNPKVMFVISNIFIQPLDNRAQKRIYTDKTTIVSVKRWHFSYLHKAFIHRPMNLDCSHNAWIEDVYVNQNKLCQFFYDLSLTHIWYAPNRVVGISQNDLMCTRWIQNERSKRKVGQHLTVISDAEQGHADDAVNAK